MHYSYYLRSSIVRGTSGKGSRRKSKVNTEPGAPIYTKTFNYRYMVGELLDVEVHGVAKNKTKKMLAQAAEFYASILMPRRIVKNVYLDIKLKKKLHGGASGYCEFVDKDGTDMEFAIELCRDHNDVDLLKDLAHEMVHLKQYSLGELYDGTVYWKDTRWHNKHYSDRYIDYWDQPWEIEAYGREIGLYSRYVQEFGL